MREEEDNIQMDLTLGRPMSLHNGSPFMELHDAHSEDHIILHKISKIEAYLKSLADERRKIEAFKRELPICMQLLCNEIKASREQLCDCKNDETCTLFENSPPHKANFTIPLHILNSTTEEPNNCESLVRDCGNRPCPRLPTSSWLTDEIDIAEDQEVASAMANKLYRTRQAVEEDLQTCSHVLGKRPGGAFVPFLKDHMRKPLEESAAEMTSPYHHDAYQSTYFSANSEGATAAVIANNGISRQPSPHRKPRRCWSAELHRKFLNALKQLGGSEVATPKQIRELMQVDGLTNDEVKSHLQKYRLHTKRPNPMSIQVPNADAAQAAKVTPQLVVLGGIWVPPEYPLKQGLGHSLYINHVPHLMDQTLMKQGQPLFDQHHIHTQEPASTH